MLRFSTIFCLTSVIWFFRVCSTSANSRQPPNHDDVDHIEEIEVEQTQIIITTSKNGPVEHLKVHIELVDIEQNKKVNPVDLSGLWLTITRGRYTIPFLRPDTWYGVRFRSENLISGRAVMHEEERLIKTRARGEPHNLAASPMSQFPTAVSNQFPIQSNVQPPPMVIPPVGVGLAAALPPTLGVVHNEHFGSTAALPGGVYPTEPGGPRSSESSGASESFESSHVESKSILQKPSESQSTDTNTNTNGIDVKMHRSLDGVETFESLYVTVGWKDAARRSNLTTGVVKLRVICNTSETEEVIKLKGDEDSVTIEITMDQKYDIEEVDKEKHQIKAHITPLKCHRICWTTDLVLTSGFGDFTKHLASECKEIAGTTSTTFLRNVKKVSVIEDDSSQNQLIVETEVIDTEYGIVTLILQKLGGNDSFDMPIEKTFDTVSSNGRFVVPVEDDAIYAVTYNYMKTKPFHYTSNAHFLVESPAVNSSKPSRPLVDLSVVPDTFDFKHDKKHSALKPEPPFLMISRSPYYSQNDLIVRIEPFCNETEVKFRLDDRYPQHQVDAVPFLCGLNSKWYFCDKNVTEWHKCDSTLCFSTSVLIELNSFESDSRCLNVTQHFLPLISTSNRLFLVGVSLLSVLSPLLSAI